MRSATRSLSLLVAQPEEKVPLTSQLDMHVPDTLWMLENQHLLVTNDHIQLLLVDGDRHTVLCHLLGKDSHFHILLQTAKPLPS